MDKLVLAPQNLRAELEAQAEQLEKLQAQKAFLQEENSFLREQLRLMKCRQYGPSTDTVPGQPSLFEEEPPAPAPEPERETIQYYRKKPGRKGVSRELETEEIVLDIEPAERQCACGQEKARIGHEETRKIEYIPAKTKVINYLRPKYACQHCKGTETEGPVVTMANLDSQIEKSPVTPSLMSHILLSKMIDSVPFYRQEKQLERLGLKLHRGLMASWTITLAKSCSVIVERLIKMVKNRSAIQLDETTVQVMNEENKKNTSTSYMWLLRAGPPLKYDLGSAEKVPEIVLYWYQSGRSGAFAKDLVKEFRGHVQTDDYSGYKFLHGQDATEQCEICWKADRNLL